MLLGSHGSFLQDLQVALQEARDLFRGAAKQVRDRLALRPAQSTDERVTWSLSLMRAVAQGHAELVARAVRCYPQLGHYVQSVGAAWTDERQFHEHLR
eukprot:2682910-Pyramimonas_sp.AAC.2